MPTAARCATPGSCGDVAHNSAVETHPHEARACACGALTVRRRRRIDKLQPGCAEVFATRAGRTKLARGSRSLARGACRPGIRRIVTAPGAMPRDTTLATDDYVASRQAPFARSSALGSPLRNACAACRWARPRALEGRVQRRRRGCQPVQTRHSFFVSGP